MQKRQRRSFFEVLGDVFNFRMWLGADALRSFWQFIVTAVQRMFVPSSHSASDQDETFEQAQARLGLSDEVLISRQIALFRLSLLLFVLGIILFSYAFFQLFYGSLHGFLLTLSVAGLALVISFRYHFWAFQIKRKKLGCSLREWYRYGLRGEK
jgi:intracellular multiplication protein IcmV